MHHADYIIACAIEHKTMLNLTEILLRHAKRQKCPFVNP